MFFKRGVARASLEEVARSAGVTRGAVYWHFRDKLDLFAAIEERLRLPQEAQLIELHAIVAARCTGGTGTRHRQHPDENLPRIETMQIQMTVVLLRVDYIDEMAPALERQAAYQRRFSDGLQRYFRDVVPPPGRGMRLDAGDGGAGAPHPGPWNRFCALCVSPRISRWRRTACPSCAPS